MSNSETLDRGACLELMRTVGLGRVAWTAEDGRVVVEPVNFVIDDDGVVFRTGEGDKLDAVRSGRSFSFEVDEVEPALRVGWSVLVSGRAEVVSDVVSEAGPEGGRLPLPWDRSRPVLGRIRTEQVSGRRRPLHPGGVSVVDR